MNSKETIKRMTRQGRKLLAAAAKASGKTQESVVSSISGILRRRKCRDTSLFSAPVTAALSCVK